MSAPATKVFEHTKYVFLDYENVREIDLDIIGKEAVFFTLLIGASQAKLSVELVEKLIAHAASVQLIRLTSSGTNALDFSLAYYLGRAVQADPAGSFHIVSGDRGFDPLVQHLKSRGILVQRHATFQSLGFGGGTISRSSSPEPPPKPQSQPKPQVDPPPLPRAQWAPADSGLVAEATRFLSCRESTGLPKKRNALLNFLRTHFTKSVSHKEVVRVIDTLIADSTITLGPQGKLSYHFKEEAEPTDLDFYSGSYPESYFDTEFDTEPEFPF